MPSDNLADRGAPDVRSSTVSSAVQVTPASGWLTNRAQGRHRNPAAALLADPDHRAAGRRRRAGVHLGRAARREQAVRALERHRRGAAGDRRSTTPVSPATASLPSDEPLDREPVGGALELAQRAGRGVGDERRGARRARPHWSSSCATNASCARSATTSALLPSIRPGLGTETIAVRAADPDRAREALVVPVRGDVVDGEHARAHRPAGDLEPRARGAHRARRQRGRACRRRRAAATSSPRAPARPDPDARRLLRRVRDGDRALRAELDRAVRAAARRDRRSRRRA